MKLKLFNTHYGWFVDYDDHTYPILEDEFCNDNVLTLTTYSQHIPCFVFTILDISNVSVGGIWNKKQSVTLEVELLEEYDIPLEFYVVSEQISRNCYNFIKWVKTLEDAKKELKKYKAGEIVKYNKFSPGGLIVFSKKLKEEVTK